MTLADEAEPIWRAASGPPARRAERRCKAYLRHNQVQTGLFFAAYPEATVEEVNDALAVRKRTIDFAIRSEDMDATTLQRRFLQEF